MQPSNRVTAILHTEIVMSRSRLIVLLLAPALVAAVLFLLLKERRQPSPVRAQPSVPETQPPAPVAQNTPAKAITPVPAPAQAQPVVLPPGTTVATPGGRDPNGPIPAAPRDQRVIRDHRNEVGYVPPVPKVTSEGVQAASAAIRPAVASCLSGPTTLQFTVTMSGGRAQAQDPKLMDADRKPEDQACVAKALAGLSWNTPDKDGTSAMTIPLISSSSSKN